MSTNHGAQGQKSFATTLSEEMDAFDRLPKAVREALAEGLSKYSAAMTWKFMTVRGWSVRQVLNTLEDQDREIWRRYLFQKIEPGNVIPIPHPYRDNPRPRSPHGGRRLPRRFGCKWI